MAMCGKNTLNMCMTSNTRTSVLGYVWDISMELPCFLFVVYFLHKYRPNIARQSDQQKRFPSYQDRRQFFTVAFWLYLYHFLIPPRAHLPEFSFSQDVVCFGRCSFVSGTTWPVHLGWDMHTLCGCWTCRPTRDLPHLWPHHVISFTPACLDSPGGNGQAFLCAGCTRSRFHWHTGQ